MTMTVTIPGQQTALAIAGADEIGDGGDAMDLGDAHDAPQHEPEQHRHQGGTQINRQKIHAAGGRQADAAVESPGRAVNRQGQGVDVGVGDDRTAGVGALVAVVGDPEQNAHIGQRAGDDDSVAQHVRVAPSCRRHWNPRMSGGDPTTA
jgi:hypothetical protein